MAKKKKPKDANNTQTIRVQVVTTVDVTLDNSLMPTEEWRSHFYPLFTLAHVAEHIAFNYVKNGIEQLSRLDGYADRDDSLAVVKVIGTEADAEW